MSQSTTQALVEKIDKMLRKSNPPAHAVLEAMTGLMKGMVNALPDSCREDYRKDILAALAAPAKS